jgi:hypothetical protein
LLLSSDLGARLRPLIAITLFSGGNLPVPDEIDDRMTPESLDALADALSVRWPDWYPAFALELATKPNQSRPFWLPGGFIFASPRRAFEDTIAFRRRERFFSGAPSVSVAGPEWPGRPLPDRYVVIGETGEGPVIVDTADEAPRLLWLDKEGYWREPLIDFTAQGKTPVEVARAIVSGAAAE